MNWAHLPEPGGIYGQNPKLIDRFEKIMMEEARVERRKQKERDRKQGKTPPNVRNPGPPPM